jgi:hypothetical protein
MLVLVVLAIDDGLVHGLMALRREGLRTSVVHVDAGSFAPAAAAAERASLGLALSAAGIGYLSLERGADLQAALSMPVGVRHARLL